jgi:hypothetical protein
MSQVMFEFGWIWLGGVSDAHAQRAMGNGVIIIPPASSNRNVLLESVGSYKTRVSSNHLWHNVRTRFH